MTTESLASAASGYHSVYDRQGAGSRLERIEDDIDANTTETYYGEWKNDIRTGEYFFYPIVIYFYCL